MLTGYFRKNQNESVVHNQTLETAALAHIMRSSFLALRSDFLNLKKFLNIS